MITPFAYPVGIGNMVRHRKIVKIVKTRGNGCEKSPKNNFFTKNY
jgi:hypothetical protein